MYKVIFIASNSPSIGSGKTWWENGGIWFFRELHLGPFSRDNEGKYTPALPNEVKLSLNTFEKLKLFQKRPEEFYFYVPSWKLYEIMRIAQLIKHDGDLPVKWEEVLPGEISIIKRPLDFYLNEAIEDIALYKTGRYCVMSMGWKYDIMEHPAIALSKGKKYSIEELCKLTVEIFPDDQTLLKYELESLPESEIECKDFVLQSEDFMSDNENSIESDRTPFDFAFGEDDEDEDEDNEDEDE